MLDTFRGVTRIYNCRRASSRADDVLLNKRPWGYRGSKIAPRVKSRRPGPEKVRNLIRQKGNNPFMNFNLKLKRYGAGEGPRYIARPRVVLQVAAAHRHTSLIPGSHSSSSSFPVVFFLFCFTKLVLSFTRLLHFRAPCRASKRRPFLSLSLSRCIVARDRVNDGRATSRKYQYWCLVEIESPVIYRADIAYLQPHPSH